MRCSSTSTVMSIFSECHAAASVPDGARIVSQNRLYVLQVDKARPETCSCACPSTSRSSPALKQIGASTHSVLFDAALFDAHTDADWLDHLMCT